MSFSVALKLIKMQKIFVRHLLLKLIATSAKLDFGRAPQYNLYELDTIYNSNSHAPVLTSIDRVTSALGNEKQRKKKKEKKKKIHKENLAHGDLPGGTRTIPG